MDDRDSRRSGGYLPGPDDGRTSVDLWGPYDGQSPSTDSLPIVARGLRMITSGSPKEPENEQQDAGHSAPRSISAIDVAHRGSM